MAASMNTAEAPPKCPNCDNPMKLVGVVPAIAGHPKLLTFKCEKCGAILTDAKES